MSRANPPADLGARWRDFWQKFTWALGVGWDTNRQLLSALFGLTLLRGLLPAGIAMAGRSLLNSVSARLNGTQQDEKQVYLWLSVGLGLAVLAALVNNVQQYVRMRFQDEMDIRMTRDLLQNAATLEVANFEDPEFQDLFQKTQHNPSGNGAFFITLILSIGMGLVQIISLFSILIYLEPLIIPLLLLVSVPYFLFRMRFSRQRTEEDLARTQRRRWTNYYLNHLISPSSVSETKMLNLGPLFLQQYHTIREQFRQSNQRFHQLNLIGTSLFTLGSLSVVYIAFTRATLNVINNNLLIGDIAIFAAAATQLRSSIENTVDLLGAVQQQLIFTGIVMDFLALKPRRLQAQRSLPQPVRGAIDLKDVTFTYPGSSTPVLHNLNLSIEPGEMVALVGHNGSGKTTLVKLIARLYDVDSGSLCIDGVDVRQVEPASLHQHMAFVFQNFGRFEATVHENIAYGRWEKLMNDPQAVRAIAEFSQVDTLIQRLPKGYETRLGRLFGETTLSGGQWQQIALARALARQSPIVILDEPTANLDMHAEYQLYKRYRQLAQGRTTILISHRFSTVRMADKVVVLENGQIMEHGTHDELLLLNEHYATLFQLYQQQMNQGIKTV